jgi:endonuclease/exonuclease/phosphatase family metal-dependent hydrolase
MRILLLILGAFLATMTVSASRPDGGKVDYAIGFYNLENLFDTCHDEGKNDYEFLAEGTFKWTGEKYVNKLHNMARVLSEMGTDKLQEGCAAIGVAEVENARCLTDLCNEAPLKARNYQFVHIEGPDQRGVDCALLYDPARFSVRNVKLVPYIYRLSEDSNRASRGFLIVSGTLAGEHVTIVVNHLPSRGATSYYREEGGSQLRVVKDSLLKDDPQVKLLIMGDMNDDPQDPSMAKCLGAKREKAEVGEGDLYNPWWNVLAAGEGTLQFQGSWNLFDQIILSANLLDKSGTKDYSTLKLLDYQIFRRDYLIQQEGEHRGNTLRTSAGGKWLNGFSDHLPTLVYLKKK